MNIDLLKSLCEASAVSGDEQEVRDLLIDTLEGHADEIAFDGLGCLIARKGTRGPKVAIVGHMDEVGFMVTHITEDGFIRFDTISGWWSQSMLNHRVTIRTRTGEKIPGIIGSVAPHVLTEKQKLQPLSFDEMFIDIGANSRNAVLKRDIAQGDFISPEANFARRGEDKLVAKALDNRVGCALMAELFLSVDTPNSPVRWSDTIANGRPFFCLPIKTLSQPSIKWPLREVMNCRVVVAFTPDELVALSDECQPALIVNNRHFVLDDSLHNVLTIRNIITAVGIDQIKDFLASAFIRQQPERFFPREGSFHYVNHALIACACAENRQELKVFIFLARMLSSHSPQQIDRVESYEALIALLR